MFTGLVQSVGRVYAVKNGPTFRRIVIDPAGWAHGAADGDSICVSGCCLTVASRPDGKDGLLAFDVIPESLSLTSFGSLEAGDRVNLERSLRPTDAIGGHFVQGHVDGLGEVLSADDNETSVASGEWRLRIAPPESLRPYLAPKGSICIDGVSLTLAALDDASKWFEVALIPATLAKTTLVDRVAGDSVHLEMDVLAKQVVHYLRVYGPSSVGAGAVAPSPDR